MAVMESAVVDLSLKEVNGALRAAVEAQDVEAARAILEHLGDHADDIAGGDDVGTMAVERDRLDRIARALRGLEVDGPVVLFACGYLADADRRLDRARTRALGRQAAQRAEQEDVGVRDRVLALLVEPLRPRDVAQTLACDPSQVSRALNELLRSGAVVRVPRPEQASGDGRAHWYARSQMDVSAAA
jgi:CRP-like cAMP-binding protein